MRGAFPGRSTVRFGVFEVDLRSSELRKRGLRIRLQGIPFQILEALLERPGDVISREELRRRIWPPGTFVDFENSLNSAVNRLRTALGDSAESPRFVETLPRRGYRFIAPVERTVGDARSSTSIPAPPAQPPRRRSADRRRRAAAAPVLLAALLGLTYIVADMSRPAPPPRVGKLMLAVLPFKNLAGGPEVEHFSAGLTEEIIVQLGRLHSERLGVIATLSTMPYKETRKRTAQIGEELGVGFILEGSVRRQANRVRIIAQLVRVADQSQLWSGVYEGNLDNALSCHVQVAKAISGEVRSALLRAAPTHTAQNAPRGGHHPGGRPAAARELQPATPSRGGGVRPLLTALPYPPASSFSRAKRARLAACSTGSQTGAKGGA